eukprot:06339_5
MGSRAEFGSSCGRSVVSIPTANCWSSSERYGEYRTAAVVSQKAVCVLSSLNKFDSPCSLSARSLLGMGSLHGPPRDSKASLSLGKNRRPNSDSSLKLV